MPMAVADKPRTVVLELLKDGVRLDPAELICKAVANGLDQQEAKQTIIQLLSEGKLEFGWDRLLAIPAVH